MLVCIYTAVYSDASEELSAIKGYFTFEDIAHKLKFCLNTSMQKHLYLNLHLNLHLYLYF